VALLGKARFALAGPLAFALSCASPVVKAPTVSRSATVTPESVTLLAALRSRFPAAGAAPVCADAPLRFAFTGPVVLGDSGRIVLYRASAPNEPIDSIDLAETEFDRTIRGRPFHTVRPVFVEGNDAVVYFHGGALAPNESYFVTVDEGVFLNERGASLGQLTSPEGFRFSTRANAPARPDALSVALDGSGDFCTVQGAVDFVPEQNRSPVTITLKNGTYHEIVLISNKPRLTLRGEDRKRTQIVYANNDNLQRRLGTRFRALVGVENSDQFTLENLTLHNLTTQQPPGGSGYQAEALRVEGSHGVVLRNSEFISRQDTLLLSGHVYVVDSRIEGNVDFVWGKGVAYFERSELHTSGRAGYVVQSRNPPGSYGYVFVDSRSSADPELTGTFLARIDANEYPGSNVAFVNCKFGTHIAPAGFLVTPANAQVTSELRFWEYQSSDLDGHPLNVAARAPASRQLREEEARELRDRAKILGWDPNVR
jgi:pectin methylesterase-like acyl-CoA thioesterase